MIKEKHMSEREILTADEANELPRYSVVRYVGERQHVSDEDSAVLIYTDGGWLWVDMDGRPPFPGSSGDGEFEFLINGWELLYKPEVQPPNVGEYLHSEEDLHRLPVGAVVVDPWGLVYRKTRYGNFIYVDDGGSSAVVPATALEPERYAIAPKLIHLPE